MEAFAGESQANRKYAHFADKAADEGFKNIAKLFKAASEAEAFHAKRLLKTGGVTGTTVENLQSAVQGETHEFTEMYPAFIEEAEKEGNQSALNAFTLANEAEKAHHGLYEKALAAVEQGQDYPADSFYLCPVCGYVHENEAPDRCPICGAPGSAFKQY